MTPKEAVEWIEKEWDLISGCLGKLSEGSYDEEGFTRFIDILKRVDADKNELLNRRFVASTWAIPHMLCELSRIDSLRRDQILKAQMQCSEELTRIYGTP